MEERIIGLKKALPYLRLFREKIFVIKVGGEILSDQAPLDHFAEQVALLYQVNIRVVLVHGGGPQATQLAERLGIPVETVNGRRVTCPETLEVAKMVFNGKLNTDLLAALHRYHVPGVGLSGVDGGLIRARRRPVSLIEDSESGHKRTIDFGFVGDIVSVDPKIVLLLLDGSYVPVISALAGGESGAVYNVNADTIAARVAGALKAEKLIILSRVPGVLRDADSPDSLISHMDLEQLEDVLRSSARGGMRPKLEACREALHSGVRRAHIISGLDPDTLLREIFTNSGAGTMIEGRDGQLDSCNEG